MKNENEAKQLFIPDKLKVGFQKRDDTYTGQLAYVIYYDKKGELRKEQSWQHWRDKKIESQDFDNVPTEGFVLNKKVGGCKSHWNFRDAHVRVYDPRGFEFEISVPNLLFILREGACSPGKGLEGQFVYAWEKNELVLLPCHSQDYKHSQSFTNLQDKKVGVKELKEGVTYLTKKQEELTYLGRFDYFFLYRITRNSYYGRQEYSNWYDTTVEWKHPSKADQKGVVKKFVFWNGKNLIVQNDIKNIATAKDDTVHPDYAHLVDKYNKSSHGSKVVRLFLKEVPNKKNDSPPNEDWFYEDSEGRFIQCRAYYAWNYDAKKRNKIEYIQAVARWYIDKKTGLLTREDHYGICYANGVKKDRREYNSSTGRFENVTNTMEWREPTQLRLFGETENGSKHRAVGPSYEEAFEKGK